MLEWLCLLVLLLGTSGLCGKGGVSANTEGDVCSSLFMALTSGLRFLSNCSFLLSPLSFPPHTILSFCGIMHPSLQMMSLDFLTSIDGAPTILIVANYTLYI